jgi:uncharacterized protein
MTWIQTYTAKRFFPLAPRAEDLDLRDLAHSLSLQCRFNGHCREFYSVAEHSVRVSRALPPSLAAWGLLHDAAEAYLSDLPTPIKQQMPRYQQAEAALLRVVAARFELEWPMPEAVVHADRQLLATEARDLMAPAPEPWALEAEPLAERIEPWTAAAAEQAFLERYRELRP